MTDLRLVFGLENGVDSFLAEQILFKLLGCWTVSLRRSIVQPRDPLFSLAAHPLELLNLPLFLALLLQLAEPLLLLQRLLLLLPYSLLVLNQAGMPALLQVQVCPTDVSAMYSCPENKSESLTSSTHGGRCLFCSRKLLLTGGAAFHRLCRHELTE
jgi:hypothetical protein